MGITPEYLHSAFPTRTAAMATSDEKNSATHIDAADLHDSQQVAAHATDFEDHDATVWQTIRRNPWACFWCLYACWTIVLVAYERISGSSFPRVRANMSFLRHGKALSAARHLHRKAALLFDCLDVLTCSSKVVACLITGQIADWIGRRYTLLIALIISFIAIAIEFIATTNPVFFAGKLINGLSIGIIATMMVGYVGVSYGIGPLVAFIIIKYTGAVETRWAYRTIFCSQWGFATIATIAWPWMPE
jgi:SP family general alpha glucoside:H+ symporter-like MFS transporter